MLDEFDIIMQSSDFDEELDMSIRIFALYFRFNNTKIVKYYKNPHDAYLELRGELFKLGFAQSQGRIFYGDRKITMKYCQEAVTILGKRLPWLTECVISVSILKIENKDVITKFLYSSNDIPA